MIRLNLQIRRAVPGDQQQIASLMFHEANLHRHLDWRAPIDWLGSPHFWVIEDFGRILAAFACPEDPPGVAWIRVFVHLPVLPAREAWEALWSAARESGMRSQAAAIVSKHWFQALLLSSGFQIRQEIVLLELRSERFQPPSAPPGLAIRPLTGRDVAPVAQLDLESFGRFWHNSAEALGFALNQAAYASIAEDGTGLVGYQLSTGNPFGAHLARLAVRPDVQGRGVGGALVSDLVQRLGPDRTARITVNTQGDNLASLALYQKLGFQLTRERFPVLVHPAEP